MEGGGSDPLIRIPTNSARLTKRYLGDRGEQHYKRGKKTQKKKRF